MSDDAAIREALEAARQEARESLLAFACYTMPSFEVSWHHRLLCEYLEAWIERDIGDLIVSMPPRHGKSELASRRAPAYIFGKRPNARILAASYGADLAVNMSRDVQRIIDSEEYSEVFPGTRLSQPRGKSPEDQAAKRTADEFEIVSKGGGYIGRGVGGGLTGKGGDYLVIDDPVKDRKEADSPTYRQSVWDWYTQVLSTRRAKGGGRLIIMTRWHEDDLAGRIIEKDKAGAWTVLSLPAIAEGELHPRDPRRYGEALWPSRFGLDFLAEQRDLDPRGFEALYQGRPTAASGNIFQRDWFRKEWESLDGVTEMIQSWDMAFRRTESGSYVVGQVWGRRGADFLLIDQIRGRMSFTETCDAMRTLSNRWPEAYTKLVEAKANGDAAYSQLSSEIGGIEMVQVGADKVQRAQAITRPFRSGNVYMPPRAHWIEGYIHEMTAFPNAANDDQVDATSQALAHLLQDRFIWSDL